MKEEVSAELLRSMLQDLKSAIKSVQSNVTKLERFMPDEFPETKLETIVDVAAAAKWTQEDIQIYAQKMLEDTLPECKKCKILTAAAFELNKKINELRCELYAKDPNNFPREANPSAESPEDKESLADEIKKSMDGVNGLVALKRCFYCDKLLNKIVVNAHICQSCLEEITSE